MTQAELKAAAGQDLVSTNPANPKDVLGSVVMATAADVDAAVAAARAAQPAWQALGVAGRVQELQKLYDYIATHKEDFAQIETREMGRPISSSRMVVDGSLTQFEWNLKNAANVLAPETTFEDAEVLHQVWYEPYGVFGIIAPWNFPLDNFIFGALQPLLAGNTVVYKASEEVPLCAAMIASAWQKAGLPAGVLNVLQGRGDVGEMIARAAIDFLDFTGSSAVGEQLYKIAGERFLPVRLELGGSDAGIVFADADLDKILEPIFWAKFVNTGQICCGLKRLFVQQPVFDSFVQKFADFVRAQKIGDPADESVAIGSLAAVRQQKLLAEQVEDARAKGAQVLLGGQVLSGTAGAFYEATLLTGVTKNMRAYSEELFGPVLPIYAFNTDDEVIAMANDSAYGLSAYVFTADTARAVRIAAQLAAGSVSVNGVSYYHPANPFGGYKRSGMGRVGGAHGLRHCCQIKTVATQK